MTHRNRSLAILAATVLLPTLALTAGYNGTVSLQRETSLRQTPEGSLAAFLPAGTAVDVLEEKDGWLRVRLEGWIQADNVSAAATTAAPVNVPGHAATAVATGTAASASTAPTASAGATAPPSAAAEAVAPAAAVASAGVEGQVQLKTGRRKARPVPGAEIFLLPGEPGPQLLADLTGETERLAALQAEADELKRKADVAMQTGSFTSATAEHDRLQRQRAGVMNQVRDILAARHGRHAAYVRGAASVDSTSDESGWYTLAPVQPGTYTVYMRLVRDDIDVEWIETVQVSAGMARLDLSNMNVRGLAR